MDRETRFNRIDTRGREPGESGTAAHAAGSAAEPPLFSSDLAHDLREPLCVIAACARILIDRAGEPKDGTDSTFLDHIVENAAQATRMVDALRTAARTWEQSRRAATSNVRRLQRCATARRPARPAAWACA